MKWKLIGAIGVIGVLGGLSAIALPGKLRAYVKRNIVRVMQERFDSQVEIRELQVSVFPRIHASAQGIVLRHHGRTDVPPLITIDTLTMTTGIMGLLHTPKRVANVELHGLHIRVPSRGHPEGATVERPRKELVFPVVIEEMVSDDALLEIFPKKAGKLPMEFDIHHVVLYSVGLNRPAHFHATLTNPKPIGEIDSEGEFGPWQTEEPSSTPVRATFRFSNADLGPIRGIAGTLSSTGKYSGELDHLDVEGDTDTPNFSLDVAGNPLPLKTHYVAVVDGTNGDTYLTTVVAHLARSTIVASGQVTGALGVPGKHIVLDARADEAKVADLLRLGLKGNKPPLTGSTSLRATIDLRPGQKDIIDRLLLHGQFGISGARFTNPEVQEKMDSLSRRGKGRPEDEDIQNVIWALRGSFDVQQGTAKFSNLAFHIAGAEVRLSGWFNLKTDELDFHGHLLLDAKLSQTVKGPKSFLLKFIDPFFKKAGGGSDLPIKIAGTRSNPSFGLELHRHDAADKRHPNP